MLKPKIEARKRAHSEAARISRESMGIPHRTDPQRKRRSLVTLRPEWTLPADVLNSWAREP